MGYGSNASIGDLVGAKILAASLGDHAGEILLFMTDRGLFTATPYGDCCANCYIQHVSGTWALAPGAVVAAVEDIELSPVPDDEKNDEASDVWGHRIVTDKGICSIEMRVDHSGYYGGSLDFALTEGWPDHVHTDCQQCPELLAACGCWKVLDDF